MTPRRGADDQTGHLFSYLSPDQRVPADHPLRAIRQMTDRVLLDDRHGLVREVCVTHATGTAEVDAATLLIAAAVPPRSTVGADKGYDQRRFVHALRARRITPHVAAKRRRSALDARTTRHAGYAVSRRKRKLVGQVFGWLKTVAGLRQVKHRGGPKVDWQVTFAAAAYNLVRLRTLQAGLA